MPNTLRREACAEFLGTFVLIIFGVGTCAQVLLGEARTGEYLSINFGWGLAVMLGVYVAGSVSGAHLNPAVTLAMAVRRGFPWSKVGPFVAAQVLGAFVASAFVYVVYYDALMHYTGGELLVTGEKATAGIWATYPQSFLSSRGGLLDQIGATALLLIVIAAITDPRNSSPPGWFAPVVVAATVTVIGIAYGLNCGYAINPARDLGPRLFTFVAGWGSGVFTAGNGFWWIPIVGPCLGGVLGIVAYDLLVVGLHPPLDRSGAHR
jgi:aquaporin-9